MVAFRSIFKISFVVLGTVLMGLVSCSDPGAEGPAPPQPAVELVDGGADPPKTEGGADAQKTDGGAPPQTGDVRYLAIGDSITEGRGTDDFMMVAFPTRLSERWRMNGCTVDLKNVGVRGYTSADLIAQELPEIAPYKPTFITIQDGANDIINSVPIDTYRANMKTVLAAAQKSGARVIVLPQNEWFRSPTGASYSNAGTPATRAAFDAALIEEASAAGAELIDLRTIYKQQADMMLWASDGIHPTPACYDQIAAELARVIPSPCTK